MIQFEAGKTYETRSNTDWECIISAEIVRRTDRTLVIKTRTNPEGKRVKIYRSNYNGSAYEYFLPWGNFSLSPVITAKDARQ
jgi:hypothetical protein